MAAVGSPAETTCGEVRLERSWAARGLAHGVKVPRGRVWWPDRGRGDPRLLLRAWERVGVDRWCGGGGTRGGSQQQGPASGAAAVVWLLVAAAGSLLVQMWWKFEGGGTMVLSRVFFFGKSKENTFLWSMQLISSAPLLRGAFSQHRYKTDLLLNIIFDLLLLCIISKLLFY